MKDPEKSAIFLFPDLEGTGAPKRCQTIDTGALLMTAVVVRLPGTGGLDYFQSWAYDRGGFTTWHVRGGLRRGSNDLEHIVEAAESPESILSGTKVFADWWEKYGPVE